MRWLRLSQKKYAPHAIRKLSKVVDKIDAMFVSRNKVWDVVVPYGYKLKFWRAMMRRVRMITRHHGVFVSSIEYDNMTVHTIYGTTIHLTESENDRLLNGSRS